MNWYDRLFMIWDEDDEITKKIELTPEEARKIFGDSPKRECSHIWREYTGLTDVDDYCILCDIRRSK